MFGRLSILAFCIALWAVFPTLEGAEPPNEWGTYYSLPMQHQAMDPLFIDVFNAYTDSKNCKTDCKPDEAYFLRWYVSSKNPNYYILSYYCRAQSVRGYEHLKVDIKNKKVLEFQSSLAGYGIIDAGEYIEQVSEDNNGTLIETELLEAVKEQIAMQKMDIPQDPEYCPDPGTQTLFDIQTKIENGLYYTRIAISCNVSHLPGYASHMTNIEVVENKDFKKLDEGVPILATMEVPKRNTMFIEQMEAEKQSGVDPMAPGLFISLVPAMWIVLKYGYMGDN